MSEPRLIGHYRILELLGVGAMGKVHVALDTFIEREVAIKSLRPELTRDAEFVSRFRVEATSLARLNHPNITTLYSSLLEGDDVYMVMELVRGRGLDEILRERNCPLGVEQSLAIVAQAADGLSYAHQMGVIHRDIKPSNLMIAEGGRVKIMDFGIARVRGSVRLTRVGTAIGTPLYMAPEQRRGSEGDERSDLYSLAIVLYEMLSGAPPFAGLDEVDLLQAQMRSEPPPLVPHAPGVTPELEATIMKALAKRPEHRFASVRAFSDAIGATALRLDATGIVKSPAHLIAVPIVEQEADAPRPHARVLALAKSRSSALFRRFKALHPAVQGVLAAVAAFVLLAPLLLGFDAPGGSKKHNAGWPEPDRIARLDDASRSTATDVKTLPGEPLARPFEGGEDADALARMERTDALERLAQKEECNAEFGVGDCRSLAPPGPGPAYGRTQAAKRLALSIASSLAQIRKAMKEKDFEKAFLLAEPLAEAGDREAQFQLGMISLKAQGRQNFATAFKWMKQAADQEFPEAQAVLGNMYQNGDAEGGENTQEAVRWYLKAAEQNNARGQYWLGRCYELGAGGLKKDFKKAGDLYRKASLQEFAGAAQALQNLRKTGRY